MKTERLLAAAGLAIAFACSGCVVTTSPGGGTHKEWAGTYAREQSKRSDADREVALRVRKTLSQDPEMKKLHLRIFVHDGEVTLCGKFPNEQIRAKTEAMVSVVKGVSGVDFECSND